MPEPRTEMPGEQLVSDLTLHVALVHLPPLSRRGLAAALSDVGHRVHVPEDLDAWAQAAGGRKLVITTDSDEGLGTLERLRSRTPHVLSVALLSRAAADRYGRALPLCTGAVPIDVDVEDVLLAVQVAGSGHTLVPVRVARELAVRGDRPDEPPLEVSDRERGWLRELAAGATVARLARSSGYSEREMYRLLSGLYQRLGADSRTAALLRADRYGLLDPPPARTGSASPGASGQESSGPGAPGARGGGSGPAGGGRPDPAPRVVLPDRDSALGTRSSTR